MMTLSPDAATAAGLDRLLAPDGVANLLVVAAVLAIQIVLLWRSRRDATTDDSRLLEHLETRFQSDIEKRAERGIPPDWLRYQDDIDRQFEFRDERLRINASAALAVGLGGTILALIINLVLAHLSPLDFDPIKLVLGLGVALGGSLLGVMNNLFIVLRLLPMAEMRFQEASSQLIGRLLHVSEENLPQELFSHAIRDELALLRHTFQSEFSTAFSGAVKGFPDVVKELGNQVGALAGIVEYQGETIQAAIADLRDTAATVEASGTQLGPAALQLAESTAWLVTMPAKLKAVLEETRDSWVANIREDHQKNVQQLLDLQRQVEFLSQNREERMLTATRSVQDALTEVRDAVSRLPENLVEQIDHVAGRLGIEFGRQARDHVNELEQTLKQERDKLLQSIGHHEQEWRNNIGEVVRRLLAQVSEQVDKELTQELHQVSLRLKAVTAQLPKVTQQLAAAHQDWTASQKKSLAGWSKASGRIEKAAEALAKSDGDLTRATAALDKSAGHLERVADLTADFEAGLTTAFGDAAKPVHEEMAKAMGELRDVHGRINGILERQSDFIRQCIAKLLERRKVATLDQR